MKSRPHAAWLAVGILWFAAMLNYLDRIYGIGRGFFDANHRPVVRQLVDERYSATGYGFLNFMGCAAGGVMIYVGGRLKDAQVDLSHVFQFAAAGLVAVGLLLMALKTRTRLETPANTPRALLK